MSSQQKTKISILGRFVHAIRKDLWLQSFVVNINLDHTRSNLYQPIGAKHICTVACSLVQKMPFIFTNKNARRPLYEYTNLEVMTNFYVLRSMPCTRKIRLNLLAQKLPIRGQFHQCFLPAALCAQILKVEKAACFNCLFYILGTARVKAAHKMLMKLTPDCNPTYCLIRRMARINTQ